MPKHCECVYNRPGYMLPTSNRRFRGFVDREFAFPSVHYKATEQQQQHREIVYILAVTEETIDASARFVKSSSKACSFVVAACLVVTVASNHFQGFIQL